MLDRISEWLRTSTGKRVLAIFALAFVVRLLVIAFVQPDPRDGRYDDSVWYDTTARHMAAGHGYVFDPTVWYAPDGTRIYPNESKLSPSALWPPGYPATLAVIYRFTGNSETAGRLFNVLTGALTAVLVFAIARKLFGQLEATFAGILMALLPGHLFFTPLIMSETYSLFLLTATMVAFLYSVLDRDRPSLWALAGVGLLAGMTAMTRGEFILFPAILLALLGFHLGWRRALIPGAVLTVTIAALFTPWVIRNKIQMGEAIVGTTGAGRVALQGHFPKSEGVPDLEVVGRIDADYAYLPRTEREVKVNSDAMYRARTYAWNNKLDELRLLPRRMYALFRSDESAITWAQSDKPTAFGEETAKRLINLSTFVFWGVIAFALISCPLWWRTRDPKRWLVFAPVPFGMVIFGVIFIGDPRYHFAMYASLVTLASPGLAVLWRLTAERWRDVAGGRSLGDVLRTYGTPDP